MEKTGGFISLERAEVYEAVYVNDKKFIIEALEEFGFAKNAYPSRCFSEDMYELVFAILTAAAEADAEDALVEEKFVFPVIDYLAGVINLTEFLDCFYCGGKECDMALIPKELKVALKNDDFDEKIAETIDGLSGKGIMSLAKCVIKEPVILNPGFSSAIIKGFYKHNLASPGLIFAFMTTALIDYVPECCGDCNCCDYGKKE